MAARFWGVVGVGAVGLASVGIAAPASAAEVPGCGEEPVGGTLTNLGSVCEVDFSAAGTYSWTVPAGVTELFALLVGAGSGAFADGGATGYAGSGGEVIYADFSGAAAGGSASITVGAGGASVGDPSEAGGDTTISLGSTVTALGGAGTSFGSAGFCGPEPIFSGYAGTGDGAGGSASQSGDDCSTVDLFGVNPAASDVDSDGTLPPALFGTLNEEFGAGGDVVVDAAIPADDDLAGTGQGANVEYSTASTSLPNFNDVGGSGRAIFRYPTLAPAEEPPAGGGSGAAPAASAALPDTGVATSGPIGIVALFTLLGSLLLLATRRRGRGAETE